MVALTRSAPLNRRCHGALTSRPRPRRSHGGLSVLVCLGLAVLGQASEAHADRRIFPYSYGYMTLPKGGFEIEHYLDATVQRRDNNATADTERTLGSDWRHQVELEYGITDHWDFGFYSVFEQKQFGDLGFRGVKLRTRYRFGEQGAWFVDPALYAEVIAYTDQVKLEQILILAKTIRRLEIVLNVKLEEGWTLLGPRKEFAFELIPSFGVGWHITRWVAVGVEYQSKLKWKDGELEHAHFLGPTLSFGTRRFYWSLGVQPELAYQDGRRLKFQARSLFGILF